jgi:PAS domain S-box-containing protein
VIEAAMAGRKQLGDVEPGRMEARIDVGSEPPSVPQSEIELGFFELALDLMVIVGFDGCFKRVNPAYARTLGYARGEVVARPFADFVHPEDLPSVRDMFVELVHGRRNDLIGEEHEHRVICRDGSVRWLQWNSRIMPERGVVFGVGRDVTVRRRADAELHKAQRMLEASRDELVASRARIVAAADEERRRVVRDLHDGAQARLVHTVITLKLALGALQNEKDSAPALVTEALGQAEGAMAELRELAHGILPAVLTSGGLRAGVDALASRTPMPVENRVSVGRLPAAVEATAYFVVAEALTNVAKHARARHAEVTARVEGGTLTVHVRDDGLGGARPDGGGLVGLADRLAGLDGQLRVESPSDGGTLIAAAIPIGGSAPGVARLGQDRESNPKTARRTPAESGPHRHGKVVPASD